MKQKIKVFVFAFLLLSVTVIPSSSLAYAAGDLVVDINNSPVTLTPGNNNYDSIDIMSGGELIIPSGVTVTLTQVGTTIEDGIEIFDGGKLTIESGGKLIVAVGITLNNGEIFIDGSYQHVRGLLWNIAAQPEPNFVPGGEIYERCGELILKPTSNFSGKPAQSIECVGNETQIVDWVVENSLEHPDVTVNKKDVLWLYGMSTIFGAIENFGEIFNLSIMDFKSGELENFASGKVYHVCAFFTDGDVGLSKFKGTGAWPQGENEGEFDTICSKPIANNDGNTVTPFVTTTEDDISELSPSVLVNDSDADLEIGGETYDKDIGPFLPVLTAYSTDTAGSIVMNLDGTFTYDPKDNYEDLSSGETAIDTFSYTVDDGTGGIDTGVVTVAINGVNDDPTAVNDPATGNISINEDSSITIPVLNNDSDPEEDTLSITSTTQGTIGTATHDGTDVTYTPNPNSTGSDSFTYTISDGNGGTSTATVNINVIEQNDIPVITLNGLTPVDVELNIDAYTDEGAIASDPEDGDISELIVTTFDPNIVDESVLGTTEVIYNVEDSLGNAASEVRRTVNVVDRTDPVITLTGSSLEYIVKDVDTYTELGATVTDNDPTTSQAIIAGDTVDVSKEGTYTITYDVSDPSENAASQVTRTVNVIAGGTPTITLIGSDSVELVKDVDTYTELGATADDSEEGDISSSIVIAGDIVDESTEGTYTITYDVQDASGNDAVQVIRTVDVVNDNLRERTIEQITELEDLIDEAKDKKTRDEINKALKELDKSVETKKWEDNGNYLIDNEGKKVFDEQDKGVKHIVHLLDDGKESDEFLSKVTSIVLDLIDIDEELSGNEFTIAEESPDSEQSCLDDAEKELEKSDKEEGKGEYDKAIDHLGHLWEKSLKCQGIDIEGPGRK